MSKAGLVWLAKGNGRRKIGKNKTVLKAVEMIRPYAKAAYFLMVVPKTPEKDSRDVVLTSNSSNLATRPNTGVA